MKIKNQKLFDYLLSPKYDSIRVIADIMPSDFINNVQNIDQCLGNIIYELFVIESLSDSNAVGQILTAKITKFLKSLLREMGINN